MVLLIVVLLLAVILAGAGFALHLLWWIALAVFILWLLGFVVAGGERRRWYRW
ncbi:MULTISPECIES: hydrophobic protein [Kitasatospora]|uniref:Hydrophobic protein n=1 Tax=Kitasatospora cystarginea TaxID=58350 RepID=A0ABP5R6J1_9ACTN